MWKEGKRGRYDGIDGCRVSGIDPDITVKINFIPLGIDIICQYQVLSLSGTVRTYLVRKNRKKTIIKRRI